MYGRTAQARALALSATLALSLASCESPHEGQAVDELSQNLPSGFTKTRVASGLSLPTGLAFAPDGRIFVIERGTTTGGTGRIRIIKNGSLLSTAFASFPVNNVSISANERGLLGIALDPNFSSNQFVYVYYTNTDSSGNAFNQISRFTGNGDVAVAGSQKVLLKLNNLNDGNHNGGALAFGKDGKLYVGVGENHNAANATNMSNYLGKVLRINPADGSAPSDNPFFDSADGITAKDRIWSFGHRNVWRLAVQPTTGRIFANDVGESTWEEINDVVKGKDFGWRGGSTDGDSTVWFKYDHSTGKCITGGTFYNPPSAPGGYSAFVGKYFFTDYANGWIKAIDTSTKSVSTFDTGINAPTDIQVGPDGNLYFTATGSGEVWKVTSTTAQQSILLSDTALSVTEGSSKAFTVRLAIQPSANVSVAVARTAGDGTVTVSPASLTFTTSNWSTAQTVTVAAAQDADSSNESATITVSSSGLASPTVNVTAVDDDVSGPLTQLTAPLNGATVSGRNAEFYGGSNLDGSTTKGEFYVDGVLKYTDVGPGHYHYLGSHQSWDTTQLSEGTHALRLTVFDASNRSGSHDIQVTVDNMPAPWNHQDIGAVGAPGGASASGGVFTMRASGADIWGTLDELHYAYQPMNGDGQIVARVTSIEKTADWSKAGVMMRTSTAANSAYAFMLLSGAGNVSFQRRLTAGGSATATNSTAGTSPLWVRLKRVGNTITASRSTDGNSWADVGTDTIAFGTTVNVGLAVTSHADPTIAQATFDSVTVGTGGGTCTPETNAAFCTRLAKNCGTVTGADNCGTSRTVSSCGTCTAPQTCGGGGTQNVCGGGSTGPVYTYLEAESGSGAGTSPLSIVSDASASGGKVIWSATTGSNLNPPTNGHVTYPFSVGAAGAWKLWGRFLVGPATSSDDSLWVRVDGAAFVQWNDIYPRVGNSGYAWDSVHDTANANAAVTYNLTAGNHTLEIAYRESGLKMDRFLLTNDLAFTPSDGTPPPPPPTCTPETDAAFCSRLSKTCGSVTGTDNCGAARTVASCGTCTSPQTCGGGGTPNMCGSPTCSPETNAAFCTRLGKNCGSVTGTDNCGASRTVTSCGTCTSPQTCGGGGTQNVCGGTTPPPTGSCSFTVTTNKYDGPNWWGTIIFKNNGPSASSAYQVAFDVPSGVQCDFAETGWSVTQSGSRCTYKNPGKTVAAGDSVTMNYSTNSQNFTSAGNVVVSDSVCGGGGTCTPESNATFCSRLGKNCGSVTGADNCGTSRTATCGTCTSPQTCGGGGTPNVCGGGSCTAETNAAFCTRLGKNCGSVTGTDNCGTSRTVSSCGTCTSPATCGGGGTPNVCGSSSGGLVWQKANLTNFTSYPDPGSEECIKFNGCMWAGQFAFVNGTQSESWVMSHNIAAVHEKDAAKYALKTLRLKQGTKQIDVVVYDECADSDCSGCCTENATQNGLNFLIDVEKYTMQRFGTGDGIVDWACIDCN